MAKIIYNKTEYHPASKADRVPLYIAAGVTASVLCVALLIAFFVVRYPVCGVGALCCFVAGVFMFLRIPNTCANIRNVQMERAGEIGEQITEDLLSLLPEDYTLLRNTTLMFDGKIAETDNIVIGKTGVFIIEVKNDYGQIIADYSQKEWKRTKTDAYGNVFEKTMRSPVKQVGFQRWLLSRILKEKGLSTHIEALVFFSHEDAHVLIHGETNDVRVFTAVHEEEMLSYILKNEQTLMPQKAACIEQLLTLHHDR